ncbi:MAG: hypothetical protein QOC92_2481, partial [Acidimicrobiaceae bacterium]
MGVTMNELSALPLFEGCVPEDLHSITDAITGARHVDEGEVICAEGDK